MPTHPFLSIRTRKANCPTCCLPLLSYCYSGIHHCQLSVISFITLRLSSSFHIYLNISRALLYSSLGLVPSVTWSSLRGSLTASQGVFQLSLCLGEPAGHRNNEKPLLSCQHLKSILEFISKQKKQQTFQKFRIHSIFNFPRLFLQLKKWKQFFS